MVGWWTEEKVYGDGVEDVIADGCCIQDPKNTWRIEPAHDEPMTQLYVRVTGGTNHRGAFIDLTQIPLKQYDYLLRHLSAMRATHPEVKG